MTRMAGDAWRLGLAGFAALTAAMGIGRFVYTPILPVMVAELGLSKGEAGLIASANFLGYLAGALLAAGARSGGARRTWLLAALGASALTTGAMALDDSYGFFLAMRFLGGVASALVLVFASSLVLDRLAALGRAELSAVHFGGVGGGIALAAVLVSASLVLGADWRELWLVNAAGAFLAAGLVALLLPKGAEPAIAPANTGPGGGGRLAILAVAYGLFGFGYVVTATFIVAIVRGSAAIASLEPVVWLLVGLGAIPSVALWGMAGRRVGELRAFALAAVVEAIGVAASVLWTAPAGIVTSALLLGGTFMGLTALGLVAARRFLPGAPRRAIAIMTAAFGVGQIVGPSLAGFLVDRTGSFLLPSIAAALALLLAAGLTLRLKPYPAA